MDELRELVGAANAAIATANVKLVEADRLTPFDAADIESRWHAIGSQEPRRCPGFRAGWGMLL